jgi:hypothetical protein
VRLSLDFHSRRRAAKSAAHSFGPALCCENPHPACFLREVALWNCTKSGQAPVDGLHSIENKSDKGAQFLLTAELEGVKRESFFDSFLSFSGWCGVRGSSCVTLNVAKWGGKASKGL